jgi:energy-coupling factor transporter transmembrane protein EcfT
VKNLKSSKSILSFIVLIFSSFFRWWWATIAGFASIVSLFIFPQEGIMFNAFMFSLLILFGFSLIFLALSSVYQSWQIYQKFFTSMNIVGFLKSDTYGDEYVLLLESETDFNQGTVIELKRFDKEVEVAIALVEIIEKNSKEQYQASLIWISPIHLRDLKMGHIVYSEIKAEPYVKLNTLQKAKDYIIK